MLGMVKAKKQTKVPVSERALVQRLNRSLAADGMQLKKTVGARAFASLGDYYVIDIARNFVVEKELDIEALGRKRKVLAEWELLEEKDE
jgi:hypothetical protein